MKGLAFAGSNSIESINKQLVKYTLSYFTGHQVNLIDLNDYEMPLFSVDRERATGHPQLAYDFVFNIEIADFLVISLAEHNRSYTTAFKNLYDWISRVDKKFFREKPMLLMSTSPGAYGGGNVMHTAKTFFPQFGANIIETFSLPSFHTHFNPEQGIIEPELKKQHEETVIRFLNQLKP
ncbi:NADPH-dependent FMN reductase [Pseudopedobacter beijingensis]|uniref:NADPH-dependent FMN reductase n=1 Tax=Pseudopedobacter beijingensis TaxID=1207056 RepID=A0ABW4IH54_9SPHI